MSTQQLTSKERMQLAMEHKEPDRVPYRVTFVPEVEKILKKRYKKEISALGVKIKKKHEGVTELDLIFGHDMLLLAYGLSTSYYREILFSSTCSFLT